MGDEVAAGVDDGDVHRTVEGPGFGLDGFNDTPGGFEIDGEHVDASFREGGHRPTWCEESEGRIG
jgi:hypothetical protein